jgi:hypothetical protein
MIGVIVLLAFFVSLGLFLNKLKEVVVLAKVLKSLTGE